MKDDSLSQFVIGTVAVEYGTIPEQRSKQDEIREGIIDIISGEGTFAEMTEAILTYLHSQGVVIKVEDWLPIRNGMTCTVESLVGG